MSERPKTKSIDLSIEIDAPADTVWEAISSAEELQRWFPLNAEIEPGVGGTVTIDWGPGCGGTADIEVWEEGERLVYVERPWGVAADVRDTEHDAVENETIDDERPAERDAAQREVAANNVPNSEGDLAGGEATADEATDDEATAAQPVRVAVEYTIASRGGKTVLRMVNSGFSADADWEEYLDTLDSGWRYFLLNLKHYLERHRGTPRRMVWERRKIALPKAEAWPVLFGEGGLARLALPAEEDAPATLWSGDDATVAMAAPPIHLALHCEALNDALLFVELEPGAPPYSLGVWLSLYGVEEDRAAALQSSLEQLMTQIASGG